MCKRIRDRLWLVASAVALLCSSPAIAATISLKVARVNNTPVPGGPVDTITVAPGSSLTIEAFLQGWAPELLRGYQLQIDPAGYTSGQAGALAPQSGGALIDALRVDFAFAGASTDPAGEQAVAAVDTSTASTRWAAALFDPSDSEPDAGSTVYLA